MRAAHSFARLQCMNAPKDDLSAPLPQGVLSDLGHWTLYQSFRTFTWRWLLRRGMLFWPLAILAGAVYATWHATTMTAWQDWPGLAWRACLAALVSVSAGPAMATFFRHLRLPTRIERPLVIAAIATGIWVGLAFLNWAGNYHEQLMMSHSGRSMNTGILGHVMAGILDHTVNASMFMVIVAGGGLATIFYFGEARRVEQHHARTQLDRIRLERDTADMRLAVLQAQVEPHFLFNTLASVRSLIASEPARAAETIDALAGYLRAAMPQFRATIAADATLGRQLDICIAYLKLMNIRTAGRIRIVVDVDANMREMSFPPLILLTLVENAVKHGIEPQLGPGTIAIIARLEEGRVIVRVEDDGQGLRPGFTPGTGLANVRAQLRNRFGERASLEVMSRSGGGVCARLTLPGTIS